jgi:hypothetical protein
MPEHIVVHWAEDLGEDPPVLQLPVQCLVMHPHPPLHHTILCRIHVILVSGAYDFARVAVVALGGLNPLAWLEEVVKNLVKSINDGIFTGRLGALGPHQVPRQDIHA